MGTFEATCDIYAEFYGPAPSAEDVRNYLLSRDVDVEVQSITFPGGEGDLASVTFSAVLYETDEESDDTLGAEEAIEDMARDILEQFCEEFELEEVISTIIPSAWDISDEDEEDGDDFEEGEGW